MDIDITKSPLISVILPVFNSQEFVKESIESVLSQTFANFELIIIDDGSTDQSWNIVKSFKDPRIVLLKNERNSGVSLSTNIGIQVAKGEFIARMDADDISLPDRFEKQLNFLNTHPDVGVLSGAILPISPQGDKVGRITIPLEEPYLIDFWLIFETVIKQPAVMIRKEVLTKVKGYDPAYKAAVDYELWTRLAKVTRCANLSDLLIYYRIHDKSITFTMNALQKQNHVKVCVREIENLTGTKVSFELISLLFTSNMLTIKQARKLINLYKYCMSAYLKKGKFTSQQITKLKYSLSWRISHLIERTQYPSLLFSETMWMYFYNRDIFSRDVTKALNFQKRKN
jgi:glycosyltransferase involved in cell wall biosynthesis